MLRKREKGGATIRVRLWWPAKGLRGEARVVYADEFGEQFVRIGGELLTLEHVLRHADKYTFFC